jgi:UDP-2,3-diacylglucosamine hydrolase
MRVVLPTPTYVFSDAHLGFASADVHDRVLGFLRHCRQSARSVVINGDLFEFWFEWRTVIPRSSYRILAAMADLREAGIPVMMTAGNHDCWGGEVLTKDVGIEYRLDPWEGRVGPWATRIEHGDGLRPREDRGYRALRRLLRNRLAIRAFRWLHPDLATPLAGGSSNASRNYGAGDRGEGLLESAQEALRERADLELLIYGHSHVPALVRISPTQIYANAGTWLDRSTFLRITDERVSLREWTGSAESADLDTLDRSAKKPLA